jgi:hypothetical protein
MSTLGTNVRQPAYGEAVRDENVYRYSVRCDRAFSQRLEAAAKRAGVSVTTFVQRHFETILEAPAPAAEPFNAASFNALAFARRHGVPAAAAQIWREMRKRVDGKGELRISQTDLMIETGVPQGSIAKAMLALKDAGLVEQLSGSSAQGTKYRVMGQ